MTDELKKEAEEWVANEIGEKDLRCVRAYIDSAEPREKQIQIDAEQIRALQKQNGELTDKVKELEEELIEADNATDVFNAQEKRIAELERKLKVETELSNRLGLAYREYEQLTKEQDEHLAKLEKENAELQHKVDTLQGFLDRDVEFDNLQKENAKLKTDYEVLSCSVGDFGELQDKLEEEQRKNNGLSDNLTKAKEIIKKLIEAIHIWDCKNLEEVEAEAEQFLKSSEVEK